MKCSFRLIATMAAFGATLCAAGPAAADVPGPHPSYDRALADLRHARWLLHFPAEWNVSAHERAATIDIDRARRDIRIADIDDRKDLDAPDSVDAGLSHRDRLVRALDALIHARRDIDSFESDPAALRPREVAKIDVREAIREVRFALSDQRRDRAAGD
jgi:hypothetical protein